MRFVFSLAFVLLLALTVKQAAAEIRLPAFFSDHMVLQSKSKTEIWGTSTRNRTLTIHVGEVQVQTTSDAAGHWRAHLPAMPASGKPKTLTLSGDGTATISDVLVGEVWLCAGQSNMGFALSRANGGAEAIDTANDPLLRSFDVQAEGLPQPQSDCGGTWKSATPLTVGNFSAIAYFFARQLRRELGVPVGIVHASLGGTPIEAWSRRGSLEAIPFMGPVLHAADARIPSTQPIGAVLRKSTPGWLFNSYIHPLIGYGVRGFVWYQGESNVDNAWQYRTLFPALITDWRALWGNEHLPFLYVQLAARDSNQDESRYNPTAELREAQAMAEALPNTAMIVAIDTRAADWHPPEKEVPAKRLAAAALNVAYGRRDVAYKGPRFAAMEVHGDTITLRFKNAEGGLKVAGDRLSGFTIADATQRFIPAEARLVGDTVEVRAEDISQPVAVRYGWSRGPVCNLYNNEGLPSAPFRTDDWPGATWPKE
jgi:sialate O-acetylesterase